MKFRTKVEIRTDSKLTDDAVRQIADELRACDCVFIIQSFTKPPTGYSYQTNLLLQRNYTQARFSLPVRANILITHGNFDAKCNCGCEEGAA